MWDKAADTVERATRALEKVFPYVCEIVGRELILPKVVGGYKKGFASTMTFIDAGESGTVKVDTDSSWSRSHLRALGAHELGHATLYQAHREMYTAEHKKDNYAFRILDEGFAEHVREETQIALGVRGDIIHVHRLLRKRMICALTPYCMQSIYGRGYTHVRRLRWKGVELTDIVENPMGFLPRL